MGLVLLIIAATVDLRASEPIKQPTVVVNGVRRITMMPVNPLPGTDGLCRNWTFELTYLPRVISATFEDAAGNRGSAGWDASWTPTPTETPTRGPTSTPTKTPESPPPVSSTPEPASPRPPESASAPGGTPTPEPSAQPAQSGNPAGAPGPDSTPTTTPTPGPPTSTPTVTPTPTAQPYSWWTSGPFGWRYSGEVLEVTHECYRGNEGFTVDGRAAAGQREGNTFRASWKTSPGLQNLAYGWTLGGTRFTDSMHLIFTGSGYPVGTPRVVTAPDDARTPAAPGDARTPAAPGDARTPAATPTPAEPDRSGSPDG